MKWVVSSETTRKELVKAYFKVLSSNILGGTEEIHDITQYSGHQRSKSNPELGVKENW
jgi:hypothetical protein